MKLGEALRTAQRNSLINTETGWEDHTNKISLLRNEVWMFRWWEKFKIMNEWATLVVNPSELSQIYRWCLLFFKVEILSLFFFPIKAVSLCLYTPLSRLSSESQKLSPQNTVKQQFKDYTGSEVFIRSPHPSVSHQEESTTRQDLKTWLLFVHEVFWW